jgi:hypothetical protein
MCWGMLCEEKSLKPKTEESLHSRGIFLQEIISYRWTKLCVTDAAYAPKFAQKQP